LQNLVWYIIRSWCPENN